MRILIAEDQKDLNKVLTKKLTAEAHMAAKAQVQSLAQHSELKDLALLLAGA